MTELDTLSEKPLWTTSNSHYCTLFSLLKWDTQVQRMQNGETLATKTGGRIDHATQDRTQCPYSSLAPLQYGLNQSQSSLLAWRLRFA